MVSTETTLLTATATLALRLMLLIQIFELSGRHHIMIGMYPLWRLAVIAYQLTVKFLTSSIWLQVG